MNNFNRKHEKKDVLIDFMSDVLGVPKELLIDFGFDSDEDKSKEAEADKADAANPFEGFVNALTRAFIANLTDVKDCASASLKMITNDVMQLFFIGDIIFDGTWACENATTTKEGLEKIAETIKDEKFFNNIKSTLRKDRECFVKIMKMN